MIRRIARDPATTPSGEQCGFWIVWCEGGGSPTVKHDSLEKAKRECERLAKAHPGNRFTVLLSVSSCEVAGVQHLKYFDPEEVPF